jgi:hypothetical protein
MTQLPKLCGSLIGYIAVSETRWFFEEWRRVPTLDDQSRVSAELAVFLVSIADRLAARSMVGSSRVAFMEALIEAARARIQSEANSAADLTLRVFDAILPMRTSEYSEARSIVGSEDMPTNSAVYLATMVLSVQYAGDAPGAPSPAILLGTGKRLSDITSSMLGTLPFESLVGLPNAPQS